MKKRISELEVELTDALSRVKDLETEKQELQVKISKLTKPEKETVSFVLKGKKLFLRDGDKEKELFPDYEIHCFDESKNKKKIAVICKRPTEAHTYHIKVFNADRKLSKLSTWEIKGHESEPPSNLKWTSDTVLRVNLFKSRQYSYLKVYDFSLIETGTYEITIDDLNSLLSVEKFKREPKTAKEKWIRGIEELKDRPDLPMEGIDSTR